MPEDHARWRTMASTSVDRDAMVDEPGATGAFDLVNTRVESLTVLDQRAEFSMRL